MSTKKPKAYRITITRRSMYNLIGEQTSGLLIPDGAQLPLDRKVAAVVRAARKQVATNREYTCFGLIEALYKLDRGRGRGK